MAQGCHMTAAAEVVGCADQQADCPLLRVQAVNGGTTLLLRVLM